MIKWRSGPGGDLKGRVEVGVISVTLIDVQSLEYRMGIYRGR